MNNKDAVDKIISHFLGREEDLGWIGFIASNVETINFQLRTEAFLECMRYIGVALTWRPATSSSSTRLTTAPTKIWRSGWEKHPNLPECYFCTNDIITYGCIKALREFGFRNSEGHLDRRI